MYIIIFNIGQKFAGESEFAIKEKNNLVLLCTVHVLQLS